MNTPWYRFNCETDVPSPEQLEHVSQVLQRGELIILPTDTVYGIAADERVEGAEAALFQAKARPANLLIPRLAASMEQIEAHGAEVGDATRKLAAHFWPGALTLVLPHAGLGSIAYRIPEHAVALAVLEATGYPLMVTSANVSGESENTTADGAFSALEPSVSMVLDGGMAPSKVPSSIVRLTGDEPEILREGPVSAAAILKVLRQ